jgi:hypothetical protein
MEDKGSPSILLHWNYFIALEEDLVRLSRFVELALGNFATYSIEISRLLLTSCSEVDIVLKQQCAAVETGARAENIDDYRNVLTARLPDIMMTSVALPRFGLEFTPWASWEKSTNPYWWCDHNKVKHERDKYYPRANLGNALNSIAALLVALVFYYRTKEEVKWLMPAPQLFMVPRDLANLSHTWGGETGLHFKRVTDQAAAVGEESREQRLI